MAKLTKPEAKAHAAACELLKKDVLTIDEREFVLRNWQAGGQHVNTLAGAFFTPMDLAYDFRLEICGSAVIDLCAGIGALSFAKYHCSQGEAKPRITCIELNPDYVAVGKKVLPEAEWICADIFNLPADVMARRWQVAYANPPFGATARTGTGPRYTGRSFDGGADIKHIQHARKMLKPGGRLVAICANGPRQRAALMDEAEHWEDLPAGTFKAAGTGVNTALLVLRG